MTHHCDLLELQSQPTLSIRTHTGASQLPATLGVAYKQIFEYLGKQGEMPAGAPFVAYYNMDMENLDLEIGCPVSKGLPGEGAVQMSEIPAGRYATTLFTGPYQEMSGAYDALTQWVQANKYEPTGIVYEIYLNEPGQVPDQDLQTQILFPLK